VTRARGRAPRLETERLRLTPPADDDAETIARLANDWDVARRLARLPHPYHIEDAWVFLRELVPQGIVWAIRSGEEDALMGMMGLTPDPAGGGAEIGYWLGRPYWGRGYATEAGRAVVAYGLQRFERLTSGYFEGNDASRRVLEKLGFQEVGRGARHSLASGRALPHVDMALTKEGVTV